MGTDLWVGSWRPHRPRGNVQSMFSGPGPKYGLPGNTGFINHDPSRFRAPAYSFGTRRFQEFEDCSPGPGYLVPANMTARGKDGTPAYSIYSRPKELTLYKTPGPGAYSPEKAGRTAYPAPPIYSLSSRTKPFGADQTPGPAAYMLPAMMGPNTIGKPTAPYISMTGRSKIGSFHDDLQKTPGPGTYRTVDTGSYKNRPPHYSMTSRNIPPGDNTMIPGPGAHAPEKVVVNRPVPPQYSFGIRHTEIAGPLIIDADNVDSGTHLPRVQDPCS